MRLLAPAKLNLFLHVVGRRADGYHELQTLFQFLDLCDEVRLTARGDGEIRRLDPLPGVPLAADLAVRAAERLKRVTGARAGADIAVGKRIPVGAGLGGGSSDAAAVLLGLNRLWGLGLAVDELARLGLDLGADVPVFVRGRSAFAEGVGERLTPVELPEPWYLVVHPGCQVSTAEVFSAPTLTRGSAPLTIIDCLGEGESAGDFRSVHLGELLARTRNDCEEVVRGRYRAVDEAFAWFSAMGMAARMTGTGAALFAACADEPSARRLAAAAPRPWRAFVARGRNRSPLARIAGAEAHASDGV